MFDILDVDMGGWLLTPELVFGPLHHNDCIRIRIKKHDPVIQGEVCTSEAF